MSKRIGLYTIAGFVVLLLLGGVLVLETERGRFMTAELFYRMGNFSFDYASAARYDTSVALAFFERALAIDGGHPYVRHQIARIHFLHGDFDTALRVINAQINLFENTDLKSLYVRALIHGFKGNYAEASADYVHFLEHNPQSWAAANDYAWVLLKKGDYSEAERIVQLSLAHNHDNPWLLNSHAIALYELGRFDEARVQARAALHSVRQMPETAWLRAYPGNDPRIANEGIRAFQESVRVNMHKIILASASSTIQ